MSTCAHVNNNNKTNLKHLLLREGFIQKKSCEFPQLGQLCVACSNSSKSAIKFFCRGGRGTPWRIFFENFDNCQLNIDFLKFFGGFRGRIFLILHTMIFWSWSKNKPKMALPFMSFLRMGWLIFQVPGATWPVLKNCFYIFSCESNSRDIVVL